MAQQGRLTAHQRAGLALAGLLCLSPVQADYQVLLDAAARGDFEQVKLAIERGADLNANNGIGDALFHATRAHSAPIVGYLLEREVDRNGPFALKSLHYAIGKGFDDITLLLLEHGVDANGRDPYGQMTPLMTAARYGRANTVRQLLDLGAEVNARSQFGGTALQQAIIWGHEDIAALLRERKAEDAQRPVLDPATPQGAFMLSLLAHALEGPERTRLYYEEPAQWFGYGESVCFDLSQGAQLGMVEFVRNKNFGGKVGPAMVTAAIEVICPAAKPAAAEAIKEGT